MKAILSHNLHAEDLLLSACIWCANIDLNGLTDYALKAIIGGMVWFGFKLAADYYQKRNHKKNKEQ